MHWKLKCFAFHVLRRAPFGSAIHGWVQRRITGRSFDEITDHVLTVYSFHAQNFLSLPSPRLSRAVEFGAGRGLITSLLLSAAGAREVFAYDISRLATVEHVNYVIRQLRDRRVSNARGPWREIENTGADLEQYYGIHYRAPGDARHTEFGPGAIDFICSTSTLEHIGRSDIVSILTEGRRVSSPTALMSFIVDYHDHYTMAGSSATRFNFYRYSERVWKWFNPPNHFQNRLRHSDYESLFAECGLESVESRSVVPRADEQDLRNVPLSPSFACYSIEDLLASNGFFLLRPR